MMIKMLKAKEENHVSTVNLYMCYTVASVFFSKDQYFLSHVP